MMLQETAQGAIGVLLVLITMTGAIIVARKDLRAILFTYQLQSFFLASMAFTFYIFEKSDMMLFLAILTIVSKVLFIPYVIKRVQKKINIPRDLTFHYLSPTKAIFVTIILIFIVHVSLSATMRVLSPSRFIYLGEVLGVSLALMGMLVTFTRGKVMTKILGYLMMENGVLLFSFFVTEIPFIIEVLAMIDLLMIVLLASILALGMDIGVEEFQGRLHPFNRKKNGHNGGDNGNGQNGKGHDVRGNANQVSPAHATDKTKEVITR